MQLSKNELVLEQMSLKTSKLKVQTAERDARAIIVLSDQKIRDKQDTMGTGMC